MRIGHSRRSVPVLGPWGLRASIPAPRPIPPWSQLNERLGKPLVFCNDFAQAFSHPSCAGACKTGDAHAFERLSFIGNAYLHLMISEYIYRARPTFLEGDLTRVRLNVVQLHTLAQISRGLGLGEYLMLGNGHTHAQAMAADKWMRDVLLNVIGVIYLEQGHAREALYILPIFKSVIDAEIARPNHHNAKSRLQEHLLKSRRGKLEYVVVEESGPDHLKHFKVEVRCEGQTLGAGEGALKKAAELLAAQAALRHLGIEP